MRLRLREWRHQRTLSQSELAALSGITKATIVNLEKSEHRTPHPRTIRKLAAALGIEPRELYEITEDKDKE
jgi:transcriptional regulator with XRE-family HTH domain